MDILAPPAAVSLLSEYVPLPGVFDELRSPDGQLRPHWSIFNDTAQALGTSEIARRWEQARQLVRENRVVYNLSAEGRARSRSWPLDPFPMLVDDSEWKVLEVGLAQRARLFNALLADLYGPQRVLKERLLPAEVVFSGLLRPCHGLPVPHGIYLHLYGADLGRGPNGQWCVFRDRTQAPTGPGYSLENRFIVSRSLPELFRDCHAERLAPFFRDFRDSLVNYAPRPVDTPRIVLLTPGPGHQAYFEHAYLSRYLGYSLVQGADLTVRDGSVFLKTVSRLQPVDIILRRIDDDVADPLELTGGHFVGVTGLLQAVRERKVSVVNALGSGTAQTTAFMPFLPALCDHLLGEQLLLPSVPTGWCGNPAGLSMVEDHLPRMVIKPCYGTPGIDPVFGDRLTRKQRAELQAAVRARPGMYVAQEQVSFSTVPFLHGSGLAPRHAVLRTFAFAHADGHYQVMPGGMTRISNASRSLMVSVEQGGGSKDCWIVSPTLRSTIASAPASLEPIELRRGDGDMPSRVADILFWLGRYVERAEFMARTLRCLLIRTMDRTDLDMLPEVPVLLKVLTNGKGPDLFAAGGPPPWQQLQAEILSISLQPRRSGSLKKWLNDVGRLSSRLRDRWSPDSWRILTQLTSAMQSPSPERHIDSSRLLIMLNRLVLQLAAFSGLAYENMTRNLELRILDIGRRLERSVHTIELVDAALGHTASQESGVLEALLEIGDSSITYRQRYLTGLNGTAVLDLLMTDESNPRSVAFQLKILERHIVRLPQDREDPLLPPEQRVMVACLSELRLSNIEHLYRAVSDGRRPLLQRLCERLLNHLPLLSDVLSQRIMSHAPRPQQLSLFPGDS